jgi:hypothetical protein
MKKIILLGAIALLASPVTAALAVPMCDNSELGLLNSDGKPVFSEMELAQQAEMQLRQQGIDANMTRFWNGCIQTFVRDADGKERMRFFDPDSYREIPVN